MLSVALPFLLVAACRAPVGFGCADDTQCRSKDGLAGVCFAVGACGYPDTECPSGYRYSDYAPEPWAGDCAAPLGTDDESSATSTTGPTTGTSSESGASDGSASSSTGPAIPVCGDALVEGDEECDDGNAFEGDACNPDCRWSHRQTASFVSNLPDDDAALGLLRLPSNDVVVAGFIDADGSDRQAYVARYTPDGTQMWEYRGIGTADLDDVASGLALSPEGHVRVTGWLIPSASATTPRAQIWLAELDVDTGALRWDLLDGGAPPDHDLGRNIVTIPGGDIVMAGRVGPSNALDFAVRRYNVVDDGGSFIVSTVWAQAFDGAAKTNDVGYAIAYDPMSGGLVVGGAAHATATDIDRWLFGLDLAGTPLPGCRDLGGDDPLGASDYIFDVAVAADGGVAAVGYATKAEAQGPDAWVGYYPAGSCRLMWADTRVGAAGVQDSAEAVAFDDRGRIVIAGYLNVDNGEDAFLAKYEVDGGGEPLWEITPVDGPANGADRISDVVIGEHREIIVAGRLSAPGHGDLWVARYTP